MVFFKSQKAHEQDIVALQYQLKSGCAPYAFSNSQSHTMRSGHYKNSKSILDLSAFNGILQINSQENFAIAEPKITFLEIVKATLSRGLVPPLIPEFKGITLGGAIQGTAIESSSHLYGQFNDICLEYEILLGNGDLITASPQANSDLFYAITGSYGSLAIITLIKIKLIRASNYIKLTLKKFHSPQELIGQFQTLLPQKKKPDFIEGCAFSNEEALLITGCFNHQRTSKTFFSQKQFWNQWFLHQLKQASFNKEVFEVDMHLEDYLFRFDRGAFWMGQFLHSWKWIYYRYFSKKKLKNLKNLFFKNLPPSALKAPSRTFRFLFGSLFSSSNLYALLHQTPKEIFENLFFIQDFYIPLEKAEIAYSMFNEKTHIFPIWLCPVLGTTTPQFLSPHYTKTPKFFLNLGIYGIPSNEKAVPLLTNECEHFALEMEGRKMLYSLTYLSEPLFSKAYNLDLYEPLRKKYFADTAFHPLYIKIINK